MQIVPAANKLTLLDIDSDKDWGSYDILNLGVGNIHLEANQPLSSGLYIEDVGKNWKDLGAFSTIPRDIEYCGNGIALVCGGSHIYRSIDYGVTWTDLGTFGSGELFAMEYCGNGIVLSGDDNKHVHRSTDYGVTWTDLGIIASSYMFRNVIVYCGNGIVLLGDAGKHVYRSTDYGATWSDLGVIATNFIQSMVYCSDGVVVLGDYSWHVFRSTDFGATWTDLGITASGGIYTMAYCGNGVVLLGDTAKHVYRSTDYGATWTDSGWTMSGYIQNMVYCGNGIVLLGDGGKHVYRSPNYGVTWVDLGVITSDSIQSMVYCDNGIVLLGEYDKHVFRSDCAFKLHENALDCVPKPVNFMDFWSDIDGLVTLPADTALPDIVVADLPSGATVTRAILMLKYSAKKDTSASDNQITAGKITSKEKTAGTYVDAINLINGEAKVTASTKEGGDVHVGDNDISGATSAIAGNCTVQSIFSGVTTTGASIELYDVQVGIRVYFT